MYNKIFQMKFVFNKNNKMQLKYVHYMILF